MQLLAHFTHDQDSPIRGTRSEGDIPHQTSGHEKRDFFPKPNFVQKIISAQMHEFFTTITVDYHQIPLFLIFIKSKLSILIKIVEYILLVKLVLPRKREKLKF